MQTANRISTIKIPPLAQIVPFLAILMEVFWAYTVLAWISQIASKSWPGVPFNVASCLILALVTQVMVRFVMARKWLPFRVRIVVLPLAFLLLIVLLRWSLGAGYAIGDGHWFNYALDNLSAIVFGFLFGTYLIWRGISVGRQPNAFSDLYRRFIIGLAAIIVVLILWGFAGEQQGDVWSSVGLEIILFFGCGLLALAIANLETLRIELLEHQEATSSFTRRWISMLVILVLAILGLSIGLVSIFSTNAAGTISHFLGNLWDWLATGITYLLYPLGFLVQVLIYVAKYFLKLLGAQNTPPQFDASGPIDWSKVLQGQQPSQIPEAILLALKWGAIIAVIGLVIFFLVRALTRYWQAKAEEGVEETNETLWSWPVFRRDLKSVLGWLFRWLRKRKAKPEAPSSVFNPASVTEDSDRIYNIREIYQGLLWEGRQSGTPRRQWETPYEYGKRLKDFNQEIGEELDKLTEAYIIERYGQVQPEMQKVNWINQLWRSLRAKFHKPDQD